MDKDPMEEAIAFVRDRHVATLASVDPEGNPLAATIFYVINENYELIFKSRRASEHMIALFKNRRAALTIYDHYSNYHLKSGIQIRGRLLEITDVESMRNEIERYSLRFSGSGEKFGNASEHIDPLCISTLFKIVPSEYKLLLGDSGRSDMDYRTWNNVYDS